jgi:two-component system, chemotaxis family, sensor kinase CheA
MSDMGNDPELLAGFFDETGESLAKVAELFVELERSPHDLSIVEAIFRPVHSLKGNSAFFGFLGIKRLAHDMETVLDHVRKGRLNVSQDITTTLLAGLDGLRAMIERMMAGGQEVVDEAALEALIKRQRDIASLAEGQVDPIKQSLSVVEGWMTRQAQGLDGSVTAALTTLVEKIRADLGMGKANVQSSEPEPIPPLKELRTLIAATFTAEPEAAQVTRMAELVEQLINFAKDDKGKALCSELVDAWHTCIGAAGYNDIVRDFVAQQSEIIAAQPGFTVMPSATPAASAVPAASAAPAASEHKAAKSEKDPSAASAEGARRPGEQKAEVKSIRVSESRIDKFLHYVGELLVIGDMFNHLQSRVRALAGGGTLPRDFRRVNDTFAQLSGKLQVAIMSIRKVPVRPNLSKVPRIVRDVAVAKGKQIAVVMRGEEIEVDKSLIELIDAPLTHMARNAADHGVEMPDVRIAAGKPSEGKVMISVEETARSIVLTVSDDGAGLNLARIRAKGESLGLVQPGAELQEKDLINLIFASGLSTAEVVSDVSGRGVGMDVVKRMIEAAGGTISITTKAGEGTEFRLTLPKGVTTQIAPAFLVKTGQNLVALPLERVRETFLVRGAQMSNVLSSGDSMARGERLIVRHEQAIPIISLSKILQSGTGEDDATAVTVETNNGRLALTVTEVVGVRKIVVRPLEGLPSAGGLYAGGAMTGDGAVALIINPDALMVPEEQHA